MVYSIDTINEYQTEYSIVIKQKLKGGNKKPQYRLLNEDGLTFELTDKRTITIPKDFIWDGSSTPRFLWWLLGTDGDFEIASLIHDYLYENKIQSRKFADKEMLMWSIKVNGTTKYSVRNIDNYIRYFGVRLFGWWVWKK